MNDANIIIAIVSVGVAFASAIIGGCALWVSIRTDKRNEKQARLLVYPYLILGRSRIRKDSKGTVGVTLANEGVGLAFIKEFILYYDGKEVVRNNAEEYKEFLCGDLIKSVGYKTTETGRVGPGACINVGEEKTLWSAEYNAEKDFGSILSRLDFYIEYQSIYGKLDETFIRDSRGRKTPYDKPIIKPS